MAFFQLLGRLHGFNGTQFHGKHIMAYLAILQGILMHLVGELNISLGTAING